MATAHVTAAQRAAELTELGGFAVFATDHDGLLPLATALEAGHLATRFAATRSGLATGTGLPVEQVQHRTAVSAAQVGLVSRLWSIALASVALHEWVPALTRDQVWIDASHRNPSPLAISDPEAGLPVDGTTSAVTAIEELVVHGGVAAITDACQEHGSTSARVLVSNAASSLVAAARVIGSKVPHRAVHLDEVARSLLERPWLAAGGAYRDTAEFKRTGCCLYYRLPGHGLCPDCVLVRPGHSADAHH